MNAVKKSKSEIECEIGDIFIRATCLNSKNVEFYISYCTNGLHTESMSFFIQNKNIIWSWALILSFLTPVKDIPFKEEIKILIEFLELIKKELS